MKAYAIRKIGQNRGAPRLWLEGTTVRHGGFEPGSRFNVTVDKNRALLTIRQCADGLRVVSKHARGETTHPIIDINSAEILSVFSGLEAVRVVVDDGLIRVLPVASEIRAKRRLERLKNKVKDNEPISMGSASSGIGVLDLAAHEGMSKSGLVAKLAFANEIREDCMEHAFARNPAFDAETIPLTAPMQELAFDEWAMKQLPEVDVFVAGIPCSGASVAGRAKRALEHPESHPDVGHLVVSFLALVAKTNPAVCVLENVPPYRTSASMAIIRNQLRDLGYIVHETELDASEWGMLEHRRRMCMVAVTSGMEFSFDGLEKQFAGNQTFAEVMDDLPPDASTWGKIDYLFAKQERDAAAGKGFKPTIIDASSTKVPTLNKTLHKRQSTGTFLQHPTEPDKYRIPTVAEHARCKGIPVDLVADTTQTFGHEVCGQSISVPPFVAVFELLAKSFKALISSDAQAHAFAPLAHAA